jgi:hypothetical protein
MYNLFIKFLCLFGVVALLWAVNRGAQLGYFDKVRASKDGIRLTYSKSNWEKYFRWVAFAIIAFVALLLFGCSSGVTTSAPASTASLCPSVIEGTVDAPPIEDRVKALAIEAQSKGITLTGDYATDVRNQGGEMMLIGTQFKFVFDAGCQVDKTQSSLNLFLTDYPVEGGMAPDGSLGMAVDVGGAKVGIKGRVVDGKFVDGEVRKGWLPHIYGVLNGGYKRL